MDFEFIWARTSAGFCQIFGLNKQALAVYRDLLTRYKDAPCARVAALLAAKTGDMAEAERWYAQAAEWDPVDIETWFNLGCLRDALERKRDAIDAFRHAVRLAPHFDRAWHAIGSMHLALGEHALAIDPLRKAHDLQPMNAQLLYQIGQCQHVCGNDHAVHDVVQELVQLDPDRARKLVEETGRKGLARLLPKD